MARFKVISAGFTDDIVEDIYSSDWGAQLIDKKAQALAQELERAGEEEPEEVADAGEGGGAPQEEPIDSTASQAASQQKDLAEPIDLD